MTSRTRWLHFVGKFAAFFGVFIGLPASAAAQSVPVETETTQEVQTTPPPAAPYSLPWQLRPVSVGNVIRSDTAFAFYDGGSSVASLLLGSVKLTDEIAPLVRAGFVTNSPPEPLDSAVSFTNPVLGVTYAPKLAGSFKLAAFLGIAIPVGTGGGDDPDLDVSAANAAGIWARSAMDNAMFAVNYFTVFPGVGAAYVKDGFTLQVEATVLQLTKARGPDTQDDSRTNFTTGAHAGYFVMPILSLGAEIRHQRWLSSPAAVKANSAARDTTTVAAGPRLHFKFGERVWFRPGVAFAIPLDDPMRKAEYKIVQLDLPVSF